MKKLIRIFLPLPTKYHCLSEREFYRKNNSLMSFNEHVEISMKDGWELISVTGVPSDHHYHFVK